VTGRKALHKTFHHPRWARSPSPPSPWSWRAPRASASACTPPTPALPVMTACLLLLDMAPLPASHAPATNQEQIRKQP
jgi:hypothetical protein